MFSNGRNTEALRLQLFRRTIWQFRNRQTNRHFYLTSEKIRCQGEENDRKVFGSSSPAKYKSNCTEDD